MRRVDLTHFKCTPAEMFHIAKYFKIEYFQPGDSITTDKDGFIYFCDEWSWNWKVYWFFFTFLRRRQAMTREQKITCISCSKVLHSLKEFEEHKKEYHNNENITGEVRRDAGGG